MTPPTNNSELKKILEDVRDAGAMDDNNGAEDWTLSDAKIDDAVEAIRAWAKSQLPKYKYDNVRDTFVDSHIKEGYNQGLTDTERNFDGN